MSPTRHLGSVAGATLQRAAKITSSGIWRRKRSRARTMANRTSVGAIVSSRTKRHLGSTTDPVEEGREADRGKAGAGRDRKG